MKRILLVDDNSSVRKQLTSKLTSEGFTVTEAGDGLSGLTTAEQSRFDAVIVDYKMPLVNGVQLAKNLRANSSYEAVPIVVITSDQSHDFVRQFEQGFANEYFAKPLNYDQVCGYISKQVKDPTGTHI